MVRFLWRQQSLLPLLETHSALYVFEKLKVAWGQR